MWLPRWMLPPDCLYGQKNRTSMHVKNILTGSTIDGESTTKHAASGDRRRIILLDEFAKVEHGKAMRNATRDAALCRFINSTVAGPGTEYSKMKAERKVKIFSLMFWDHPQKGAGRYVKQNQMTKNWEIRSPWFDREEQERSPTELAQEVLAQDVESGSVYFDSFMIDTHLALFGEDPKHRFNIKLRHGLADDSIKDILRKNSANQYRMEPHRNGSLRVWTELIEDRLDQSYTYTLGCDIGKGCGASNSVISVLCNETKEKVAEWRDANTPPYEMARIAIAMALWVGGRMPHHRPLLVWEKNGPGRDFGRQIVVIFRYPRYYRDVKVGESFEVAGKKYGWQSTREAKKLLLANYRRALAHGGIINHCKFGLLEARQYVYYDDGGIGPAELIEENTSAKETHGDIVIADALTLLGTKKRKATHRPGPSLRSAAGREQLRKQKAEKQKGRRWRRAFDNR